MAWLPANAQTRDLRECGARFIPDRRWTLVPLPCRSSPGQPDRPNSRARNNLSIKPHDETGTLHVDLYRRQLSGHVQCEVRNEPPVREHVGLAAALPRLQ